MEVDGAERAGQAGASAGADPAVAGDDLAPDAKRCAVDGATPSAKRRRPDDEEADFSAWASEVLAQTPSGSELLEEPQRLAPSAAFETYVFSGVLRPAHVTAKMAPPDGCLLPDYALHPTGHPRSEFLRKNRRNIPVVEGEELEIMREACALGREVLDIASRFTRAGVTGDEIDRVVWRACAERGLYPSPLNYMGFPKSVCVSVNEVICHGIPDQRPLRDGDIVNLDVSVYHRGFHADLNETLFVGQCDEESHKLVRSCYAALKAASELIRPGAMYRSLGAAISVVAEETGCATVPGFTGHGVGRLFHGPPEVPHFRRNKAVGKMQPGHIFTIEPMLTVGAPSHRFWPDEWTAVTRDGGRSAQFEHSFLVTETGFEVLTARGGSSTCMPDYDPLMFQR